MIFEWKQRSIQCRIVINIPRFENWLNRGIGKSGGSNCGNHGVVFRHWTEGRLKHFLMLVGFIIFSFPMNFIGFLVSKLYNLFGYQQLYFFALSEQCFCMPSVISVFVKQHRSVVCFCHILFCQKCWYWEEAKKVDCIYKDNFENILLLCPTLTKAYLWIVLIFSHSVFKRKKIRHSIMMFPPFTFSLWKQYLSQLYGKHLCLKCV